MYIKDSMKFSFYEIQQITNNISNENLLGEGGYEHVYKGEHKDGHLIVMKRGECNKRESVTTRKTEITISSNNST